ncbi:MAG: NUDIX domain-containing protein [bacterium]|nr:NUDIX domain-containing protein [bacterium]
MGQQNYKIFINQYTLFIGNSDFLKQQKEKVILYPASELKDIISKLTSGAAIPSRNIAFETNHSIELYDALKKQFKLIKAAGGIVFNEQGQLLLIKRLGLWDLPKGKIEKGESQRIAALREVHEECGLHFLGLLDKIDNTYHVYFLKGRWILKKTAWYKMIAWGNIEVTPQLEEDITEVRWVDKDFLKRPDFETYDSIRTLMQKIEFPKVSKQSHLF